MDAGAKHLSLEPYRLNPPMQRLARIAGSFAIVVVAYWVYAQTAVRLIEPSIQSAADGSGDDGESRTRLTNGDDYYLKQVQGLFKPGDWPLDKQNPPKVLDINNRAKLLLQEYQTQDDGRIKLYPCTMVFLYDGPAESEEERLRQSIVLEAPEGALVQFDTPLDAKGLKFGRPVGAELLGNIVIRSDGKSPGPEDDLLIHARHLVWSGQDATSDQPVDFQWGKNSGRGSGLHITLVPRDPSSAAGDNGPNVSRIELFEMRKIEKLHIEGNPNAPPSAATAIADSGGTPPANPNPLAAAGNMGPTDITCAGAFRFHVLKRVASFEKQVEVRQLNPNGPANQLLCDKLSMFFVPKGKEPAAADSANTDLEPEQIEAEGKPVTLSAPNHAPEKSVYARGERLVYHLKTNLIELDDSAEVYLQQGASEIHGKSLQYLQNPAKTPNALGKAWVKGPGRFHGAMGDRSGQILDARWNGEMNLFPKDGFHVISAARLWTIRASANCRPIASSSGSCRTLRAHSRRSSPSICKPARMCCSTWRRSRPTRPILPKSPAPSRR